WFDSDRLARLAISRDLTDGKASTDEPKTTLVARCALGYRFKKAGRYVVAVKDFVGLGKVDYSYQLRITDGANPASAGRRRRPAEESIHAEAAWTERDFVRNIDEGRLIDLGSRTVRVSNR